MLDFDLESLSKRLARVPTVLLLGQNYMSGDSASVLDLTLASSDPKGLYSWWLSNETSTGDRCEAISKSSRAINLSEDEECSLALPWTFVFTSAIDPVISKILQQSGRLVRQIFDAGFNQAGEGGLPVVRIFGTVERELPTEMPPADRTELRKRRALGASILSRLPEVVTPNGCLIVDGWRPSRDWLRPQDLAPSLFLLQASAVHIFGLSAHEQEYLEECEDFASLMESGVVTCSADEFSTVVSAMRSRGLLNLSDPSQGNSGSRFYEVADSIVKSGDSKCPPANVGKLAVTRLEWERLNQSFTIIEPLSFPSIQTKSRDELYRNFRQFLASDPEKWWPQIAELGFCRPVLDAKLQPTVLKICSFRAPQDHVVIVSGQSGSGKTVTLNILAVQLRALGFPVAYLGNSAVAPNYKHLDDFCQMLEAITSIPIIFIYDASDLSAYLDLAYHMASRGRKCLIVGSCYPTRGTARPKRPRSSDGGHTIHDISLPVEMSNEERDALLRHIERFTQIPIQEMQQLALGGYDNFFALLYRLLPETRDRMAKGLVQEIEWTGQAIAEDLKLIRQRTLMEAGDNSMAAALQRHLGDKLDEILTPSDCDGSKYAKLSDSAFLLVNSVMLVSRLGLTMPQIIALRILNQDHQTYIAAVRNWNVIVETGPGNTCLSLAARHPLEAQIWVQRRLGGIDQQLSLVQKLSQQVYSHEVTDDRSPSLSFVVKLLQALGPQGPEQFRLSSCYRDFAGIVHDLRQRHQSVHPRLLLVECNARREWVQAEQSKRQDGDLPDSQQIKDWLSELELAEQAVEKAVSAVLEASERLSSGAKRMLSVLETERACVLGAQKKVVKLSTHEAPAEESKIRQIDYLFSKAQHAWQQALRFDEDAYRALDAGCWISRDRISFGNLTPDREAEILAEWSDLVDRYAAQDLPPSQYDRFEQRDHDLAKVLNDQERLQRIYDALEARGSFAGHVLRARAIQGEFGDQAARKYLEGVSDNFSDRALLLYYTQLWWRTETGLARFFPTERLSLKFKSAQWEQLLALSERRLSLDGESENGTALFHRAWSLLQLAQSLMARDVFRRLEILNVGGVRRSRCMALISNQDGLPREFSGEVRGRIGRHSYVWNDELRIEIPFNPTEFDLAEMRTGRLLGPFHLALNYRGPYAQPVWRYKSTEIECEPS